MSSHLEAKELGGETSRNIHDLLAKARQAREQKLSGAAVLLCQEALSAIPEPQQSYRETMELLFLLGELAFEARHYLEALQYFDAIRGNICRNERLKEVLLYMGECCLELEDTTEARKFFTQAGEHGALDPTFLNTFTLSAKAQAFIATL